MSTPTSTTIFTATRAAGALATLAFWSGLVFISYMALTPLEHAVPDTFSAHLNHVAAFSYLTVSMRAAYRHRMPLARMAIVLLGYGLGIELVQSVIPYRYFELTDLAADGIGIALGVACVVLLERTGGLQRAA